MDKRIIIECDQCGGTGLYQGYREINGAAVICGKCNGAGCLEFNYNEFKGRKEAPNVKRVFKRVSSYGHSAEDYISSDGEEIQYSKYGCTYEEWLKGKEPKPVEDMYCPADFDGICKPCSRYESKNSTYECIYYEDKSRCWEEWHAREGK